MIAMASGPALAAIHLDMTEIARGGEGLGPSGWTLHAITNYTSNRGAMKLAEADSFALSPDFGKAVVEVAASVISSSAARRQLKIVPCSADGSELPGERLFDYSATKSSFTNQTVRWPEDLSVRRLRLAYDDGETTVWGIHTLDVRFASDPPDDGQGDTPPDDNILPKTDEIVALGNCRTTDGWQFSPDFSTLSGIEGKTDVGGFVPSVMCHLRTSESREEFLSPNEGKTQYQGHYVWTTNGVASGLGSYSAAQTSRSLGWLFHNDTGTTLALDSVDVMFGQWGARNSQPDGLRAEWRLEKSAFDTGEERGWTVDAACSFTAPFTNKAASAYFPIFEPRAFASLPDTVPAGCYLSIRFVDTCPSSGNNAHLGIAALTVRGRRANVRPLMMIVR